MNKKINDETLEELKKLGFKSSGTSFAFSCDIHTNLRASLSILFNREKPTVSSRLYDTVYSDLPGWEGWESVQSDNWLVHYNNDVDTAIIICAKYILAKAKEHLALKNIPFSSQNTFHGSSVIIEVD